MLGAYNKGSSPVTGIENSFPHNSETVLSVLELPAEVHTPHQAGGFFISGPFDSISPLHGHYCSLRQHRPLVLGFSE